MDEIRADIAIIGAGIMGAAIAEALSADGRDVVLLDSAHPAAGATGACDGYVSASTKVTPTAIAMARRSRELWADLVNRLDLDCEWRVTGGLLIAEDEATVEAAGRQAGLLAAEGLDARILTGDEARALEPALGKVVCGAVLCPEEAQVNPYRAAIGLLRAAIARGVRTVWGRGALKPEPAGDGIGAVVADGLRVTAGTIVLAAGIGSAGFGREIGLEIPVRPRKGELVVTERCRLCVERTLVSAAYLAAKADPSLAMAATDEAVRLGHGFVLEPLPTGQILLGSTRRLDETDRRPTPEGVRLILDEAVRRVPGLAEATVLRAFAGLRPYVPDGRPLIGRSRIVQNLIVATGHEGDGITLAPLTARVVAELVGGRTPPMDIGSFDPDRFAVAPADA